MPVLASVALRARAQNVLIHKLIKEAVAAMSDAKDAGGAVTCDRSNKLPSNVAQYGLADYFWTHTVAALSGDMPPPRLDFLFDGFRAFSLLVDDTVLLLVDYEDALDNETCQSKRGFEFDVDDEDAPGTTKRAFAREFSGSRASVDAAVDQVCTYFDAVEQWHETVHHVPYDAAQHNGAADSDAGKKSAPQLTVLLLRAVVRYDCEEYRVERRYRSVYTERGAAKHSLSRQSDRCAELALVGKATLEWLRAVHYTLEKMSKTA